MIFPTTLVGSCPQAEWLLDRERFGDSLPPPVRADGPRLVPPGYPKEPRDEATLLAVRIPGRGVEYHAREAADPKLRAMAGNGFARQELSR